jgi:hypothetical protein
MTDSTKIYLIDATSAFISALAVAPFIAIFDQGTLKIMLRFVSYVSDIFLDTTAVTEKAADSSMSLLKSSLNNFKTLVFSPIKFVSRPTFIFVWAVYGGTYVAANTITSFCEIHNQDSYWPRLIGTTAANMILGIAKDRYFAKVFNKNSVAKFPLASWGSFVVRDLLTIGAGFNFPSIFSSYLQDTKMISNQAHADKLSQLTVPMIAQMVLTPIHLLALDIYNRAAVSPMNRFSYIAKIYPSALSIRMTRVLCAYGIAGVTNKTLKEELRSRFL